MSGNSSNIRGSQLKCIELEHLELSGLQIYNWNFGDIKVVDNGKGTVIKLGEKERINMTRKSKIITMYQTLFRYQPI